MAPLAHGAPISDFPFWPDSSKNAYILFTTHCQTRDEAEMKLEVWLQILEHQAQNQCSQPYDRLCRWSHLTAIEKVGQIHQCRHRLNCLNCFKGDPCQCGNLMWLTNLWRASLLLKVQQDFYGRVVIGKHALVELRENLATKGAYCNELSREEYLTVRDKLERTSYEYEEEAAALRAISIC
jgi:hypothetical protein